MAALDDAADRCRRNLAAVRDRVGEACRRCGRDPATVRLVGVTKYVTSDHARLLLEAGCVDLAESRPQSLWEKAAALERCGTPVRWHLIGHLQRNKLRRTLPLVALVHSLDSLRLLEAIDAEAATLGREADVLLEINLAEDPGRTGVPESEVGPIVDAAVRASHARIVGLMGMASVPVEDDGGTTARRQFARLRELRDRLAREMPADRPLTELSMGMSGDYVEAILEGATIVRIGSALWEGVA